MLCDDNISDNGSVSEYSQYMIILIIINDF